MHYVCYAIGLLFGCFVFFFCDGGVGVDYTDFVVGEAVEVVDEVVDFNFQRGRVGLRVILLGGHYFSYKFNCCLFF